MKVKTTFTIEIICDLYQCVAYSVDLTPEDKDHERQNMEDCIKDSLGYPNWVMVNCIDCKREAFD